MSLIACPDCRKEYDTSFPTCIHCGHDRFGLELLGVPGAAGLPAPSQHAPGPDQRRVPFTPVPEVPGRAPAPSERPTPPKSRAAYILLAVFLGVLGVHNFYAGRTGPGIAQALISVLLGWAWGIGLVISAVWAIVDIFTIRRDGHGRAFT